MNSWCWGCWPLAVLLLGLWPAPLLDVMRGDHRTPDAADPGRPSYDALLRIRTLHWRWPEIYLAGAICVVLLFDLFFGEGKPGRTATFTLLVLLVRRR